MKTFESHFTMIKEKLLSNENFAFLRFSDGELFILQNILEHYVNFVLDQEKLNIKHN